MKATALGKLLYPKSKRLPFLLDGGGAPAQRVLRFKLPGRFAGPLLNEKMHKTPTIAFERQGVGIGVSDSADPRRSLRADMRLFATDQNAEIVEGRLNQDADEAVLLQGPAQILRVT